MHPGWLVAWTAGVALGGDPAVPIDPMELPAIAATSPPPVRGLGTITGRIPGTTEITGGVRLARHHARIVVHDGFARTEVEEEVANDTARVLEGRYAFAVPPGAAVTRLALWVGHVLVEGELVERRRARSIFRGIVEDTVRPRDPALLEHVRGGELSMTIFPLPARATRTVIVAWDEALEPEDGRLRLVHALAPGAGRAARVDDLAITVRVVGAAAAAVEVPGWAADVAREDGATTFTIEARDVAPERDLVVDLGPAPAAPVLAVSAPERPTGAPDAPPATYFAARFTVPAPDGVSPERPRGDRVVVLDTSASQTEETIAAQVRLARAAARGLREDEQLAVLACDAACVSFPAEGLVGVDDAARVALDGFLERLAPRGSSDLAGAIASGARRLARGGQLVVAHDGHATAGELSIDGVAARVAGPVEVAGADLRLVGIGRTVDALALARLAAMAGATFEPWGVGPVEARAVALAEGLDRAAVDGAALELPDGVEDVVPAVLPRVRVGDAVTVLGTLAPGFAGGTMRIVGDVLGEPVALAIPLAAERERPNPLLPKLWAHQAIAALEAEGDAARADVVALSRAHHVLSRHTSLLVLENERMFAEFGVERTTLRPEDQADHGFGAEGGAGRLALGGGAPLAEVGGVLTGEHRTRPSQVRMGSTMVSGRLPPETVQRIVRLQMGRFRACYERGLARNPALAGRIATRFVIGWTGQVVSTADGGSDLPDREVVACVVRHFQALEFPPPEGGTVVVVYPIVFSSDGTRPMAPPALWPEPTPRPLPPRPRDVWTPPPPRPSRWVVHVTHTPGDEGWRTGREGELARLAAAVRADPASRSRRERQVRALLLGGRWSAARDAAARLVELDPDLPLAHELASMAAAAEGDRETALAGVDAVAESAPRDVDAHRRAARAFGAAGDGARACAHLRALAELDVRGAGADRERAERCWGALLTGVVVTAEPERDGDTTGAAFTATVRCEDGVRRCPAVAIVSPTGRVVSRAAPFGAEPVVGGLALGAAGEGTWRTVLLEGDADARGTVRVRVHGNVREVPFTGSARTVLVTRVEQRWRPTAVW